LNVFLFIIFSIFIFPVQIFVPKQVMIMGIT